MTKLILVTGTAGAGKSTILSRLSEINGNQLRILDDKTTIALRNGIMQKMG